MQKNSNKTSLNFGKNKPSPNHEKERRRNLQKKNNEKLLEKIVKKDYNNELEEILEKKMFKENVKSNLLSMLYKIEAAYQDYITVKQDVETKEEFIQDLIDNIEKNCNEISLIRLNSEQSKMMGNRTFLIDKKNKRIICYPIERKILYAISKISKNDKIIKDKYFLIDKTLSNLINVGKNIEEVEPLRDFNGYSWTSLPRETESVEHNLVYQNLRMIIGHEFLNNWVKNKEFIIDYMENLEDKIEEEYGVNIKEQLIENLKTISILLEIKFEPKSKQEILKMKKETEEKLLKMQDNKLLVEKVTEEKRKLTKDIKQIDETLNNKELLQQEYIKRNEKLELEEKIFSIRILSKMMAEERHQKIERIEKLNNILNPQKFVRYKKELEDKEKYLKLVETANLQQEIDKKILELQKIFLECYQNKIEKAEDKQEITKLIYEFRYYNLLAITGETQIYQNEKLESSLEQVGKQLIKKATTHKVIENYAKDEDINYEIVKNIFYIRSINLDQVYIKLLKEKEDFFVQIFDDNAVEEKNKLYKITNENKKELGIKLNKKMKVFN